MSHPARFLVVVPTHRPDKSQSTIDNLRASCTYPTEFHQLDGRPSKVHAINKALQELLSVDKHDIYCTVDDDVVLPENWQHFIACAFDRVKNLGICGIDLEGTPEGETVMAAAMNAKRRQIRDIVFRDTIGHQNVCGACMAMPSRVALAVGPYPYSDDGRQYHVDEDGWRCHQVALMRMRYGYVTNPNGVLQLLTYADDPEYVSTKTRDMQNWVDNPQWAGRKATNPQ